MSGFLSRLLHRAGIASSPDEEISLLRDRSPARFEPSGPEPAVLEESVESNYPAPLSSVHRHFGSHTRHAAIYATGHSSFPGRESSGGPP